MIFQRRTVWSHERPHYNLRLYRWEDGSGMYELDISVDDCEETIYLTADTLSGLSAVIQQELELRRAGRSEE